MVAACQRWINKGLPARFRTPAESFPENRRPARVLLRHLRCESFLKFAKPPGNRLHRLCSNRQVRFLLIIFTRPETADLDAVFPQKSLRFFRIQAIRDVAEIHNADRASGQKPALTEDVDARVLIEGQSPTCVAQPQ